MVDMWLLEDLEPWPDAPAVGSVCEPTTFWGSTDFMDLPSEVCSEVEATIEHVEVDGRIERIAHLGHGFTTLMVGDDHRRGAVTLVGCLVWDRYLWIEYRSRPRGRLRVVDRRGHLANREQRTPTVYAGWSSVTPIGRMGYYESTEVPTSHGIRRNALRVQLEPFDSDETHSP